MAKPSVLFARIVPEFARLLMVAAEMATPFAPVASMVPELPLRLTVPAEMPNFVAEMSSAFVTGGGNARTRSLKLSPVPSAAAILPEAELFMFAVPVILIARPLAPVASMVPVLAFTFAVVTALTPMKSAEIVPLFVSEPVVVSMPTPPVPVALTKPEFVRLIALPAKALPFPPFA